MTTIRPENENDIDAIRTINIEAFADHPYSRQTEHLIVEALRSAGAMDVSLVAEMDGEVVGHIAFSKAGIGETSPGWMLLGPMAVLPAHQRRGIGSALVEKGLETIRSHGAAGCVLVGDPAFYHRFGFRSDPRVTCEGVPQENVLCLAISGPIPEGNLTHHPAFFTGLDGAEDME